MRSRRAFTLLELSVAVLIVAILVVLTLPAIGKLRARAQRIQCMGNLKSLHLAAEQYVQDNNKWPQIKLGGSDQGAQAVYLTQWLKELAPYHVTAKTWICPTVENSMGNPDYTQAGQERVDYFAMPFDDKPMTPHLWPHQPWFVEGADVHGNGNLIIFTDGSISDLKTISTDNGK